MVFDFSLDKQSNIDISNDGIIVIREEYEFENNSFERVFRFYE